MSLLTIPLALSGEQSFESQAQDKEGTGLREMRNNMWNIKNGSRIRNLAFICVLLIGAVIMASSFGLSADRMKPETIGATAMGTGSQLGQNTSITVTIYEFSTPEDKQILVDAFDKGQNQGLVNALTKMKAVGHIAITGTLGYDLSFIRLIPTPTGRRIRFVTNRQIRFGEAFFDSQSQAFNLTAGELDVDDTDKKKSTGLLYPAAQLALDKEGQLKIELSQNAWKLVNLIDWKGTPGEN